MNKFLTLGAANQINEEYEMLSSSVGRTESTKNDDVFMKKLQIFGPGSKTWQLLPLIPRPTLDDLSLCPVRETSSCILRHDAVRQQVSYPLILIGPEQQKLLLMMAKIRYKALLIEH